MSQVRNLGGWKVKRTVEDNIVCSLVKSPVVFIEPIPREKINLLMSRYPNQEWLGYLVGRISKEENFFVEDLSIPPHKEVSAVSATAEPFHVPNKCVGVIHSHNGMGAFHSATDQDYVDKNFPVSITVGKKGESLEFDTVSSQITPCNRRVTVKGSVKYVQPRPLFDSKTFMQEAVTNIDKGKTVYRYVSRHLPEAGVDLPYSGYADYIVRESGELMTQRELDNHLKEIWKD